LQSSSVTVCASVAGASGIALSVTLDRKLSTESSRDRLARALLIFTVFSWTTFTGTWKPLARLELQA
jgi:hypothetical protein